MEIFVDTIDSSVLALERVREREAERIEIENSPFFSKHFTSQNFGSFALLYFILFKEVVVLIRNISHKSWGMS